MKVYVVLRQIPYEGYELEEVFDSQEMAAAYANARKLANTKPHVVDDEWIVVEKELRQS